MATVEVPRLDAALAALLFACLVSSQVSSHVKIVRFSNGIQYTGGTVYPPNMIPAEAKVLVGLGLALGVWRPRGRSMGGEDAGSFIHSPSMGNDLRPQIGQHCMHGLVWRGQRRFRIREER